MDERAGMDVVGRGSDDEVVELGAAMEGLGVRGRLRYVWGVVERFLPFWRACRRVYTALEMFQEANGWKDR